MFGKSYSLVAPSKQLNFITTLILICLDGWSTEKNHQTGNNVKGFDIRGPAASAQPV